MGGVNTGDVFALHRLNANTGADRSGEDLAVQGSGEVEDRSGVS
jgi:hypothetical protein